MNFEFEHQISQNHTQIEAGKPNKWFREEGINDLQGDGRSINSIYSLINNFLHMFFRRFRQNE